MPRTPDLAGARQGDLLLCHKGTAQLLLPYLGRRGGLVYAGLGRGLVFTFDGASGVEVGSTADLGQDFNGGWRVGTYLNSVIDPCLAALLWDGLLARLEGSEGIAPSPHDR